MTLALREQLARQVLPRDQQFPYTKAALAYHIEHLGFEIGEHSYGVPEIRWWGEDSRLKMGRFCSIADRVQIFLGGNHRTDWVTTYPFTHSAYWPEARTIEGHPATRGDVVIGNDVWLASGCSIFSGVTIGDGAVVGAHSVVTRDVPPYAVVTGNPAAVQRMRFSEEHIALLQQMQWWEWPETLIRKAMTLLCASDIHALHAFWQDMRDKNMQ